MSVTEHKPSAAIYSNGDFILIETNSGRGRMQSDPEAPQYLLPMDASDESVGSAVHEALSRSRQIALEEIATFFDFDRTAKEYDEWIANLMARYGYKTKRALFKGMKNCGIRRVGDSIKFEPMRQVKLEAWEGTAPRGADDVVIPVSSSASEVGAAFRVAMERCR